MEIISTFTCWKCHETFFKKQSDEKAWVEYKRLWPTMLNAKVGILCDDCNNEFHKWFKTHNQPKPQ
jgi:hypothetical protein